MIPRPLSFYGPDDWDGITPWQQIDAEIREAQRLWDAEYLKLPWYRKVYATLTGLVTEPVGTSAGMPL